MTWGVGLNTWTFVAEHAYFLHPEGLNNPANEETSASNMFLPTSQDCTMSQPSKHPPDVPLSCKSENLNYSSAPAKCHEMSYFIGGTRNALYQNPATFIHSPCVSCCASHCWVVIRVTEVEHKWCKYIGGYGGALTFLRPTLSDFMGFWCICGSGSLLVPSWLID